MFIECFITQVYLQHGTSFGPGDTILDFGGNKWFFSLFASKIVGPTGQIIALEPNPRVLSFFSKNKEENESYGTNNIEVIPKGVFDKAGTLQLGINEGEDGSSSLVVSHEKSIDVEIIEVNSLLDPLKKIDFIKCDIEGSEYRTFRAISDPNFAKIKQIAFEIHHIDGEKIEDFISFLKGKGFTKIVHINEWLFCSRN